MYEMGTIELFQRLSIALAIGLLIGLERGWQAREEEEGERAAGLRTHALGALLGAVWAAIARPFGDAGAIALAMVFALFGGMIAYYRARETLYEGRFGATTVVAALLAFSLGAYCVLGEVSVAAAAAVAATGLLALKGVLHAFVRRLTWAELRSGLVLLVMTCILLPVLPNRAIDRWNAINPFEIWLLTVMIAAISFAGYAAVQFAGVRRGVAVAGLAGGLASSTAVTAAMARLARETPGQAGLFAAGALFADAVMSPRAVAVVAFLNPAMALRLTPALAAAAVAFVAAGMFFMRHGAALEGESRLAIGNPLDLTAVLKFGALLAVVMILSRVATTYAGSGGAFLLAALSGVADVDAIALSMARVGAGEIGQDAAVGAVLLAAAVNTVSKAAMGWIMGGAPFGWRVTLASASAVAAGGLALAASW